MGETMRILWLCNIPLPIIAQNLSLSNALSGGWLVGLSNDLMQVPQIELAICFPTIKARGLTSGKINNMQYYCIPQNRNSFTKYDARTETLFMNVLSDYSPQIIHIWGTEFPHTLAMVKACKNVGIDRKVVISIQGLVSVIYRHYLKSLPNKICNRHSLRDFIRQDSLKQAQEKLRKRGIYEIEALKNVENIIGRTDWDRACTELINPKAKYYFCNETLRDEFYKHEWDINSCERNSIFMSQASSPIKGLHFMLEALSEIVKRYPNAHLYVAGNNITDTSSLFAKAKISAYGNYLKSLIQKYNLENNVTFTGGLNESQMCERYLRSHVFVSASTIENSPNSIGEAMILGVPVISSDVGGVKNLMIHEIDGFIYQHDAPYMLTHYISELFGNDALALRFSENARDHAMRTHNRDVNTQTLISIYNDIINCVNIF
jgi:glycosyltransferase involved in cell wall biosynthesis